MDICESGACLAALEQNIEIGKLINLKLSSFNAPNRNIEVSGNVVWNNARGLGVKFLQNINLSSLN
jgi:Tfp pilus assembly protein PilZ